MSTTTLPASPVDATVLICTFNRAGDLAEALACTLAQETEGRFTYEVLVVDNNSTDDTRPVVERLIAAGHSNLRYLFEARQGRGHALRLGVSEARGGIYALADDDIIVGRDWLRTIVDTFRSRPDISFVGGQVLPLWAAQPPGWLTPRHWSALALSNYGQEELVVDSANQICLLAAAFRTDAVASVGGYGERLGVSSDSIGGTEDVDLFARLFRNGHKGLYAPDLVIRHKVVSNRTTKAYHRRWHLGHGRYYAMMRAEDVEVGAHRLFDVPAHLYRQAAADAVGWLTSLVRGRFDDAFWYETHLKFFYGFFRERRRDFARRGGRTIFDVMAFVRSFAWRGSHQAGSAVRRP
jgi:glycosyltransferase involved in cell wall biosynthesis